MEIVTITEARRRLHGALSSSQTEIETVSPETAVGRITAKDMTAAHPYPPYRKSPFDGYAICSHDQKTYDVVATIGAGLVYDGPVLPGQAVRLMTGCAVPGDCDTVIPQEYTVLQNNRIKVTESIPSGSNIIPVGEECREGAVIIPKGTKLTAGAVSAAVGMGNATFPVFAKTKILFLTSGRELVLPGQKRHDGQIYNSGKQTLVLGLSGNPSAAFNAFVLLALPIVRQLNGEKNSDFPIVTCRLSHAIHKENPVDRFVQGNISFEDGKAVFTPNTTLTSSALLGLAHVNALGCIKKGTPPLPEGAPIDAILLF